MGAADLRRHDLDLVIRLVEDARRLFEATTDPVLRTSSTRSAANWLWETRTHLPHFEPGDCLLRVSRNGGRHIVTLFVNGRSNPLMRVSEDETVHHMDRAAPSAAAVVEALTRIADRLTAERDDRASSLSSLCAGLLLKAGVTFRHATLTITPGDRIVLVANTTDSNEPRVWVERPVVGEGAISPVAASTMRSLRSERSRIWVSGNRRRGGQVRTVTCAIQREETIEVPAPDAVTGLRLVADLPAGAGLAAPVRNRRRR